MSKSKEIKLERKTSKGKTIKLTFRVDSQNHTIVYATVTSKEDDKRFYIPLSTLPELKVFKEMIEEVEKEFESHKNRES